MKIIYPVFVMLLSSIAFAHGEMVEDVMAQMMAQQGVSDIEQVDCSKVLDEDMEALGDAVMGKMIGNSEMHMQMDEMIGGEGSGSLRQMHIMTGSNWLGCGEGMMGGAMGSSVTSMMPMMMRMMGNYYPGYYSRYDSALLFAFIGWILFIAALAYMYLNKRKRKGRR